MGFLWFGRDNTTETVKQKRHRSPNKDASEKKRMRHERFMAKLEKTDPKLWAELNAQEMGLRTGMQKGKEKDALDELGDTIDKLRRIGLDPFDKKPREDVPGWAQMLMANPAIQDLIRTIGPQLANAGAALAANPATHPALSDHESYPIQALPSPQTSASDETSQEVHPVPSVDVLLATFEQMTPEQAAPWILREAAVNPTMHEFITNIAALPDIALPTVPHIIRDRSPEGAIIANWIDGHLQWFIKTVGHARRLMHVQPAVQRNTGEKTENIGL